MALGDRVNCGASASRTRPPGHRVSLETGVGGDTPEDSAYDALSRLSQAKDDDSIVNLTYDSLSRVLTEVRGSNFPRTPLLADRTGRAAGGCELC